MHTPETNEAVLCRIAAGFNLELPTESSFTENYNPTTKRVEITANSFIIEMLDAFLWNNHIVAEKDLHTLTVA